MVIDSNKVVANAEPQEICEFLKDANNLVHLLPEEKISDFKATAEECSFKVQGGVMISLVENGQEGNEKLFLKSGEKSPFPFELVVMLKKTEQGTEGYIHFDGEINAFLRMMVEKPLTNLFNYMSNKLQERFTV
jgi:carbon monoxide dehydrogenase subunit G